MKTVDLSIGSLSYVVSRTVIAGEWIAPDRTVHHFEVGASASLVPRIDLLREELRDPMKVSSGRTPRLRSFMDDWGRAFIPEFVHTDPPDVLLIVPHAALHDLPLHLVRNESGEMIGAEIGIAYASSRTLFTHCARRNRARFQDDGHARPTDDAARRSRPATIRAGGTDVLGGQSERFRATCRRLREFVLSSEEAEDRFSQFPYSRVAVKQTLRVDPQPEILCVMAHGYVDPDDHRMSGLMLERDLGVVIRNIPLHGGRYFDFRDLPLRRFPADVHATLPAEVLTAAEMEIDTTANVQLVALIGCSAGWGRVLHGDEPASLAETFLHIGAPSVIAPLWDSDIGAAEDWVRLFFAGWLDSGLPKAIAARNALRSLASTTFTNRPERFGVMTLRGDWL